VAATTIDGPSYSQVIVEALTRYPSRDAFVLGDRRVTYAESASLTSRIRQAFIDRGIRPGGAVGILSPNAPEVFLVQAATFLTGARYSGLHPLGSVSDHVFLCDDARIELLIVHPKFAEVGAQIAAGSHTVQHVMTLGPTDTGAEDLLAVVAGLTARPLRPLPVDEEDVAWLQYTGGTTGVPKGVMLSHRALVQEVQTLTASWGLPETPRYLASSPITHAAVLPIVPTLARGGTVVLMQGFDPEAWLRTVRDEQVNYAFVVPTMLYTMLDSVDLAKHDTSALESLVYGAAPMSPARLLEAHQEFGPILMQVYGQTECLGMTTSLRKDEHDPINQPDRLTSCGRAAAGILVELLDDAGNPVPDGAVGEISVRSRVVMNGYWDRPDETAEALRGGWLHTGDMAMRDPDGFLHVVDRKKDMIVTGGFNVYPKEVEDILGQAASVSDVAVVGLPDEKWGESVTAFVVAKPGATVDIDLLAALVRERKGPHQVPKRIEIVSDLPKTAVGKIDKKALRSAYWSGEDRLVH
jgi:fatty-acyl-CoA synthase